MSCGIDCIKWILFIFNFLWVLLGIALLGVGIYVIVAVKEASGVENALAAIAIGFIVLGVIVFVIAFFGCCGAVKESHCMVVTYAVFLLVLLILQVAFGIWAFVIDTDPKTNISTDSSDRELEESFKNYWTRKEDRDFIDIQQTLWSCCGVSGPSDYNQFDNKTLPSTCCPVPETLHKYSYCSYDKAFKNGCSNRILEIFDKIAKVSGGIAIGVAVAELVGIIFALCLANSIRNDHRRGYKVLGIAILAYGIFVTVSLEEPSGIQTALPGIAIGFIVLGVIIFVTAFFGCCGAVRESHCMVVTYAVFLLAILIVQVAFGIWALVIKIDSKNEDFSPDLVDPKLQKSFDDYWVSKSAKEYIDNKQAAWSCCGVFGPSDYDRFQNTTIPWSCCRGSSETVQMFIPCRIDGAFETGCNKAEVTIYNKAARITGGFSIGVAVTELVGIVFALCLANSIRNDHRRGYRV